LQEQSSLLHNQEACSAVGIAKPDFGDEVAMSHAKYRQKIRQN